MHVLFFQADTTQYAQDSFPTIANFSGLIWEFYDEEDTYKITVVEDGIISGCGCSSAFGDYVDNIDSLSIMPRTQRPECPRFKDNIWERVGTAAGNIWKGIVKFFRSIVQNGGSGNVSGSGTSNGSSGTGGSNGTGGSSGSGGNGFDGFDGFGFGGHGGGGGGSAVILNLSSIYTEWQLKLMQKAAIWMNDTYGIDYSLNELYFLMGADCIIEVGDFLQNPPAHPPIDEEFTGPVCANEFAIAYILGLFPWLTEDDETEIEFLLYNVEDREKLVSYTAGDEERTENMKAYIELEIGNPEYELDRLIQMWDALEGNPYLFLQPCLVNENELDIFNYEDLYNFTIPINCIDKLEALGPGFENQPIVDGNAAIASIDYYGVEILVMPDIDGDGLPDSPEEIIESIRNEFATLGSGSKAGFTTTCPNPFGLEPSVSWNFVPYFSSEENLWESSMPLTTIFRIETEATGMSSMLSDDGAVITSQVEDLCWIFSTIQSPLSGSQPLSGNRQFGLRINQNGNFEFYTRAVDRAHTRNAIKWYSALFNNGCDDTDYYNIGRYTWKNLQNKVGAFVSEHGGVVNYKLPKGIRVDFAELDQKLKSPVPVNFVSCQ